MLRMDFIPFVSTVVESCPPLFSFDNMTGIRVTRDSELQKQIFLKGEYIVYNGGHWTRAKCRATTYLTVRLVTGDAGSVNL